MVKETKESQTHTAKETNNTVSIDEWLDLATEGLKERISPPMKWYDFEMNKKLILGILQKMDQTAKIKWLPEYDQVAEWMTDTKGQGLNLVGDCGRGKSNILNFVIPAIFKVQNKVITPVHSQYLSEVVNIIHGTKRYEAISKNKYAVAIDEVGEESVLNDFGTQIDMMNYILNSCENENKYLFITTNFSEKDFLNRYDIRFVSRLKRLCKTVVFKGKDLR